MAHAGSDGVIDHPAEHISAIARILFETRKKTRIRDMPPAKKRAVSDAEGLARIAVSCDTASRRILVGIVRRTD